MEWEPEQHDLGGLGFTGICREIYRVSIHVILLLTEGLPGATILSALLLAHIAAFHALDSCLVEDHGVRLVACGAIFMLSEATFMCVLLLLSSLCTLLYVFRVASLYCTDGDTDASDRVLRNLPRAPLRRFVLIFKHVIVLAMAYIYLSVIALLLLSKLDDSNEVVVLPLQVLVGAACLVSAAYVAVVSHIACAVAILEDAVLFGAVRKSRALLAGKFWAAAAVFLPLDGCFVALHQSFYALVLDDALGLGLWFQVAAGAAVAVALWAVVVVTLVAQPVVYLVCKNHHHEVVDKVHLSYVGEYQRLAVDGDSGVQLQPVNTAPEHSATAAQASPLPAPGSTT